MSGISEAENFPKYRHEYKYICDAVQNAILKTRLKGLLREDSHAGADGCYRIRSLYFDSPEDDCYYENESGVGERVKYRIRIYDGDVSYISLEKKSRHRGMTLKKSCRIEEALCRQLMAGQRVFPTPDMPKVLCTMLEELLERWMRPAVIVEYVRYPFVESCGNVRITLDEAVSSSNEISRFLSPVLCSRPILGAGQSILEVKWDEFLPDYIENSLQTGKLSRSSFSKYYLCRKYNTYGGVRI